MNPNGAVTQTRQDVVDTEAVTILGANDKRQYLLLQNRGANPVYLGFNITGNVVSGLLLAAGAERVFNIFVPTSAVSGISTGGPSNLVILEG